VRVAIVYEIVRWEERELIKAARAVGAYVEPVYVKSLPLYLNGASGGLDADIALQRCISHYVALESSVAIEGLGVRVVNTVEATHRAMDKLWTISLLRSRGVPTPRTAVAFSPEAALEVATEFGFPVVVKPVNGSWGRLVSIARDEEELRTIMEHRSYIPSMTSKVHLIQEYVRKPGRDIRVFVVGGEVVAAIYRVSNHWITNTARGGRAVPARADPELEEVSVKAAEAVGGEVLGIDVFEDSGRGYLVNEVNPVPEFKNTVTATGVDIPRKIAEYLVREAAK